MPVQRLDSGKTATGDQKMDSRSRALQRARNHLNDLYAQSRKFTGRGQRSWHVVTRQIGLSVGTVIRVARDGYEPKASHIRRVLSLPPYAMIPICAKCGRQ